MRDRMSEKKAWWNIQMPKKTASLPYTIFFLMSLCAPRGEVAAQVEKPAAPLRSPDEIIRLFDMNGDGKIDMTEMRLKSIAAIDQIDKNRDGFLSRDELPGLTAEAFAAADRDKDGRLSVFEYSQLEFFNFSVVDTNKDGFITADEITAYRNRNK